MNFLKSKGFRGKVFQGSFPQLGLEKEGKTPYVFCGGVNFKDEFRHSYKETEIPRKPEQMSWEDYYHFVAKFHIRFLYQYAKKEAAAEAKANAARLRKEKAVKRLKAMQKASPYTVIEQKMRHTWKEDAISAAKELVGYLQRSGVKLTAKVVTNHNVFLHVKCLKTDVAQVKNHIKRKRADMRETAYWEWRERWNPNCHYLETQ